MQNDKKIIWINEVDLSSLWPVISAAMGRRAVVRFLKGSPLVVGLLKFLGRLRIMALELKPGDYPLGDMRTPEGSLGLLIQADLPKMAQKLIATLKSRKIYQWLCRTFSTERVDVLFEIKAYHEFFSILRLTLTADWYRQYKNEAQEEHVILCPHHEALPAFLSLRKEGDVPIRPYAKFDLRLLLGSWRRKFLMMNKKVVIGFSKKKSASWDAAQPKLALHYAEGFDLSRRSDIYWYPNSRLPRDQALVYVDTNNSFHRPIKRKDMEKIEQAGLDWVVMSPRAVASPWQYQWKMTGKAEGQVPGTEEINGYKPQDDVDQWLLSAAKKVIFDVEYWLTFFRYFNIKIVVDIAVWTGFVLEQSMALDLAGGVRVGPQRSAISSHRQDIPFLRYNVSDVFFVWGREILRHRGTSRIIKRFIVSGFPYDKAFERKSEELFSRQLRDKQVKFVLALFDNTHGSDLYFSKAMMESYYRKFLEWLMEDPDVGIVIKEKKTAFFNDLTGIKELWEKAIATGRCLRAPDALGRFPSDVAHGADMAVGVGVSSAALEAMMVGCRSVHCDIVGIYQHHYYEWGRNKVIFDDQDALIARLKEFKKNPESMPYLGDWSAFKEEIHPFDDGKGGQRIGEYLRWLLEGFSQGKAREEALAYADNRYAAQWGQDKVILRIEDGSDADAFTVSGKQV